VRPGTEDAKGARCEFLYNRKGTGDWTKYRNLPRCREVDFHHSGPRPREVDYGSALGEVYRTALEALKAAHEEGDRYVLFTHGWSTSRPGQTTARSMVRMLMRSKDSTPYVVKNRSIQHDSVFVASIRKNRERGDDAIRAEAQGEAQTEASHLRRG
jgi:hypothetical protein